MVVFHLHFDPRLHFKYLWKDQERLLVEATFLLLAPLTSVPGSPPCCPHLLSSPASRNELSPSFQNFPFRSKFIWSREPVLFILVSSGSSTRPGI